MPGLSPPKIRHQEVISDAICQGTLGELICANTPLPGYPAPSFADPEGLVQPFDLEFTAVGVANGWSDEHIGVSVTPPKTASQIESSVLRLKSAFQIDGGGTSSRCLLIRCLYTTEKVLRDDPPIPPPEQELLPQQIIVLGLVSHMLTRAEIALATGLSENQITGLVRKAGKILDPMAGRGGRVSTLSRYVGLCFETEIFSPRPDSFFPPVKDPNALVPAIGELLRKRVLEKV